MMVYLKFADETAARLALAPWIVDGLLPAYIGLAAVDVVGAVQCPTCNTVETPDGSVHEMAPVPGWHINLSERVAELQQFEISAPATPTRTFAGSDDPAPPAFPVFVGNAKLDHFTRAEQLAVVQATMTDALVKLMYDRLLAAAYLTYADPETQQGLSLLVSKGLLTPERKEEIVAAMQPR
ncbi:hypothetical protein [Comamonas thiooxydans]|uniref:hypothetical protein n=1 Tax=Comamonas thiooxydans TaxID=363952 RepID=UPI000697297E|nr:hypothetical protein [Comamonas thiooxydans]CUA97918.1 hypothetical protein Ga0061062_106211 [Comamonas thiooxydans]